MAKASNKISSHLLALKISFRVVLMESESVVYSLKCTNAAGEDEVETLRYQ